MSGMVLAYPEGKPSPLSRRGLPTNAATPTWGCMSVCIYLHLSARISVVSIKGTPAGYPDVQRYNQDKRNKQRDTHMETLGSTQESSLTQRLKSPGSQIWVKSEGPHTPNPHCQEKAGPGPPPTVALPCHLRTHPQAKGILLFGTAPHWDKRTL